MGNGQALQAIEAEHNLIGACILTPTVAPAACGAVCADDLTDPAARVIFAAIVALVEVGAPATLAHLQGTLDAGQLGTALSWAARVPSPIFAGYDAQAILSARYRRRIARASFEVNDAVRRGQTPPAETVAQLAELYNALCANLRTLPFVVEAGLPTTYLAPPAEMVREFAIPGTVPRP